MQIYHFIPFVARKLVVKMVKNNHVYFEAKSGYVDYSSYIRGITLIPL